ncbi:MAG: PDZ domain-containing protein [Rhodoblastus sp.]
MNHGTSGGPLFNMAGEVVGVNTAYYTGGLAKGGFIGIGYAIPASIATEAAALIRKYGYMKVGWVGVAAQEVTPQIAEALSLASPAGAIVAGVDPGSPAHGRLRAGDVIVRVGATAVRDPRAFFRAIAPTLGQSLPVEILRDGRMETVRLTPAELPGEEAPLAKVERPSQKMATWKCALGFDVSQITAESRREFHLDEGQEGVVVTDVKADSAAAAAGFATGDIILTVQKKAVNAPTEVQSALEEAIAAKRNFVANLVQTSSGRVWRTISLDANLQ